MTLILENPIPEPEIQLIVESCHVSREHALQLLIAEARAKIEYEVYLKGPFDPRD